MTPLGMLNLDPAAAQGTRRRPAAVTRVPIPAGIRRGVGRYHTRSIRTHANPAHRTHRLRPTRSPRSTGKKRKSVDQNSKLPLSPNSKARVKTSKKASSYRSSELEEVTPRFWERAEARAMETLGKLSPGSRKKAAKLTSTQQAQQRRKSGNGLAVQVPDLISGGAPTSITAALVRVDGTGSPNITSISGFTNMTMPVSTAGGTRVSPRLHQAKTHGWREGAEGSDRGANGELRSVRSKPANHKPVGGAGYGDLASMTGAKKVKRPRPLIIDAEQAAAIEDAGTPLLTIGNGRAAGEVPGLLSARRRDGTSLRKAAAMGWAALQTPRSPLETPGSAGNALMESLAYITTPK